MAKEIFCSEARHINFVMTSDTNMRYYFSEFVLLDIGSLSMEISECFWTFPGEFIYI